MSSLGYKNVRVVGHDIGLMVAYAYAAMYRQEVKRLALMDAFLPGVEGWEPVYNNPGIWHFRFYGPTPVALVTGRERIYFNYFWNDFAFDGRHSIQDGERSAYVAAYSRPGRMNAGFTYFSAFPKTAADFAKLARAKLTIPVLAIGATIRWASNSALKQGSSRRIRRSSSLRTRATGSWRSSRP